MTPRSDKLQRWCIAAALIALAVVPYLQTWSHAFLTYDDPLYVTNNPMVQRGLTMEGVKWAFTTFHACNWHPLTWLSHMADCALFDVNARGPLMVNLALHAINTVLLWLVLWRLAGPPWMWRSAAVAAVFAVHPLHVESVAWVSERKDLLSTMFGLLAIACYTGFVRGGGAGRYALLLVCFAASLLCKPMLVTLPCVLLLLDYWPLGRTGFGFSTSSTAAALGTANLRSDGGRRNERHRPVSPGGHIGKIDEPVRGPMGWPRLVIEKVPLFALSIASSILTVFAQSSGEAVQTLRDISLPSRIVNAVIAYGTYVGKFVAPVNLAVFYPRHLDMPWTTIGVSVIVLTLISALTIRQRGHRPWLIVGWLFFLGTLVPVIGLVQVGWQAMADRYMYVPMIGLTIAAVWSIPAPRTTMWKMIQPAAIGGVIVMLAIMAAVQAGHWRDSVALFQRASDVTPLNHVTQCNLGNALLEAQRPNEALEHLLIAVRLDDRTPLTHYDLGIAYQVLGRLNLSETEYRRAVELSPTYATAWANLASVLTGLKRYPEAIAAAQRAIDSDPELAEGHAWMGLGLASSGETARAVVELRRALEIKPRASATRVNLGVCLATLGQFDEGMKEVQTAVANDPNLVEARLVLATFLEQKGDAHGAASQLQDAARLKPNDAAIQQRLQRLQSSPQKVTGEG